MLKAKAPFGFCHQVFLKLYGVRRKRSKKAWFQENVFHFQIFEAFGNLEIDFSIKMLLINCKYFWSYGAILTQYEIGLKHAVTMPLHQGYSLTCIYGCIINHLERFLFEQIIRYNAWKLTQSSSYFTAF